MNFVGLDIGGANIKLATLSGQSKQIPFPIWKDKHELANVLATIKSSLSESSLIGVTMTAELADCFETKQEGVEFIVNAVVNAFADHQPLFYCTDGSMRPAEQAIHRWKRVAASNWHANAWMAFLETKTNSGFMVDIGSTTTDIIPVKDGMPKHAEQVDFDRLANGQLLYAGAGRTPICSLISQVELPNQRLTIARELFATMKDALLWLNETQPDEFDCDTADGRPATRKNSGQRLAKMVCEDLNELDESIVDEIARQAKSSLSSLISSAIQQVVSANPDVPLNFRIFGQGAKLAEEVVQTLFADEETKIKIYRQNDLENQTAPALAVALKRRDVELANSKRV